ncbi:hypothetical protein [uncultured Abyssibacter sp.]|uniref:hypothetical protein n=1 Tax=uncultured Abyssibacter sp. TaxID=2320202 RepID=UPI0032B25B54
MLGRLLLLRCGPQDLPYSTSLLGGSIAASIAANILSLGIGTSTLAAVPQTLVATLVSVGFVIGMLQIRERTPRAVQTLTALFSTQAVLGVLALFPLRTLAPVFQQLAENPDAASTIEAPSSAVAAWLALGLWSVIVTGHILKNALDVHMLAGVGLAILQGMLIWIVLIPLA